MSTENVNLPGNMYYKNFPGAVCWRDASNTLFDTCRKHSLEFFYLKVKVFRSCGPLFISIPGFIHLSFLYHFYFIASMSFMWYSFHCISNLNHAIQKCICNSLDDNPVSCRQPSASHYQAPTTAQNKITYRHHSCMFLEEKPIVW